MRLSNCHTFGDATAFAEKRVGLDGWKAYAVEVVDGGFIVIGCIPFGTYTRGAKAGKPRYCHPNATDHRRMVISTEELNQAALVYESSGACYNCKGKKQEVWGWSKEEGHTYRNCRRCQATGRAPIQPSGGAR